VVVQGVPHKLHAQLVFAEAEELVRFSDRNEVVKLIGSAHIRERHHPFLGKR